MFKKRAEIFFPQIFIASWHNGYLIKFFNKLSSEEYCFTVNVIYLTVIASKKITFRNLWAQFSKKLIKRHVIYYHY